MSSAAEREDALGDLCRQVKMLNGRVAAIERREMERDSTLNNMSERFDSATRSILSHVDGNSGTLKNINDHLLRHEGQIESHSTIMRIARWFVTLLLMGLGSLATLVIQKTNLFQFSNLFHN